MSSNVISMGEESVIRDTARKLDHHMNCFFFSKYSQSVVFRKRIASLPKLIQMYGNDAGAIQAELQASLQAKLAAHFTTALVSVTAVEEGGSINLTIDANVSDSSDIESGIVSVGYALVSTNSVLKSILNRMNQSVLYTA